MSHPRSTPFKTTHIAHQLGSDGVKAQMARACSEYAAIFREGGGFHWFAWCPKCKPHLEALERPPIANRTVLAKAADTDNGQCWSEEVFSMLEGER